MSKAYILTPRRRAALVRDYRARAKKLGGWPKGSMLARRIARGASVTFYAREV